MKYLILILFSFQASAMNYFLVPCSDDNTNLCRVGKSPGTPKGAICKVPYIEEGEKVYSVKIKQRPDSLVDRAIDFVGLNERDWTPAEKLAEDEYIECAVDEGKVKDLKDAKKDREDAEKSKKDKQKSDWESACSKAKTDVESLICAERGYIDES